MRRRALREAKQEVQPFKQRYDEAWEKIVETQVKQLDSLASCTSRHKNCKILQPTASLSCLYALARGINDWYQQVVRQIAEDCGCDSREAPLKSLTRGQEKLERTYKGKVPYLVDVVRSTIVATDVAKVHEVVTKVMATTTIHVIKNRLSLDYDGEDTAGYRDVQMQISFGEMEGSPFAGFVFELQVHLVPILALKSDYGHKLYIKLRNLRGD